MRGGFAKASHVSAFMGMDLTNAWRMTTPGQRLFIHIDSLRENRVAFDATLSPARLELTPQTLRRMLARRPLLTLRVVHRIYTNGLRVWLKEAGYHPNPSGAPAFGRSRRAHAISSRKEAGR
jgi:uncharacterized protein